MLVMQQEVSAQKAVVVERLEALKGKHALQVLAGACQR